MQNARAGRRLRHSGRELWSPGLDLASARSGKGQTRGLRVKTEASRHSALSLMTEAMRQVTAFELDHSQWVMKIYV